MLITILQICLYYNMLLIRLSDKIEKKKTRIWCWSQNKLCPLCMDNQVNLVVIRSGGTRLFYTGVMKLVRRPAF